VEVGAGSVFVAVGVINSFDRDVIVAGEVDVDGVAGDVQQPVRWAVAVRYQRAVVPV
jgi:hypothetical protein